MTDSYQTLELERDGEWVTVWFNQPEKRNPLTDLMRVEMMSVLDLLREDASTRGITMRGRGGIFCAGGDLKSFNSLASGDVPREEVIRTSTDIGCLLAAVNDMPQVVVASIEGAALAGGLGLACCADIVLCEQSAKFALTETALGLSPAQIAPYVINKIGLAAARRLMLTAARFDGGNAREYGIVDELVDDVAGLTDIEMDIRKQVLSCAPGAIADTKRLLKDLAGITSSSQLIDIAAHNFADRVASSESKEGITAFFDKRRPSWWDGSSL